MSQMEFPSTFAALIDAVHRRYPELPDSRIEQELSRIAGLVSDITALQGKRILDLGAGSFESTDRLTGLCEFLVRYVDPYRLTQFQPWFCRIAHLAGAEPWAVDIGDNSSEAFNSVPLDLSNPDALDCFDGASFHYVNNYCFTSHPQDSYAWERTSPGLREVASQRSSDPKAWVFDLDASIMRQVARILRPQGIYFHNYSRFKKKNGVLVPI